jgi:hypothetical protein
MPLITIAGLWRAEEGKSYKLSGGLNLKPFGDKDPKAELLKVLNSGEDKVNLMVFPNTKKEPGSKQPDFSLVMALPDETPPAPVQQVQPGYVEPLDVSDIPF